jgi:multicomponent Na+:H+ antiporter subunit D
MAFNQHNFKRLLAFHSISQVGYVITMVGLGSIMGLTSGLYHAMNHTLFKGLLFLTAGAVQHATGSLDLDDLGGLSKKMPKTTILFLIGAASISGLPPFNGFASKWMIYQATYQAAVESGNIGFLFATIVALATSVLTLASFVKVSQSVFFGQLPAEYENVKEVSFGMRLAMGIFSVLCVITGLFPELVTKYLTEPAARAVFNVTAYIDTMMGSGYAASVMGANTPVAKAAVFAETGVWSPVSWLMIFCISLLAITIFALMGKYDRVSEKQTGEYEAKYDVFFGGEQSVYSQVGGSDLFWGFKHNWHGYFDFMHNLHSGIVNDYSLWAIVALAIVTLFTLIVL